MKGLPEHDNDNLHMTVPGYRNQKQIKNEFLLHAMPCSSLQEHIESLGRKQDGGRSREDWIKRLLMGTLKKLKATVEELAVYQITCKEDKGDWACFAHDRARDKDQGCVLTKNVSSALRTG